MQGINSATYLTRSLLNRIYKKKLTNVEIEDLVISGELVKQQSYYKPSFKLLKELGVIPPEVEIREFNRLCKQSAFVMKDLQLIFDCNKDTAKLICDKYFQRKHNYWYKNKMLSELLNEGEECLPV